MKENESVEIKLSGNISNTKYPRPDITGYERILKCDMSIDGHIYGVTGAEKEKKGYLAFLKANIREIGDKILETEILKGTGDICGQPDICVGTDNKVHLVWTCCEEDLFTIKYMKYEDEPKIICTNRDICYYPCLCELEGKVYIACSSYEGVKAGFVISLYTIDNGKISTPVIFSSEQGDCFRPVLASDGRRIILAWDCLNQGDSRVSYVVMDKNGKVLSGGSTKKSEGQRNINAAVCGAEDGGFYLSWVITSEVEDEELGIIDHRNAAGLGKVDHRGISYLYDKDSGSFNAAADLREGLLGEFKYCGYYGNRRRPVPVVVNKGPMLVFEAMLEPDSEKRIGLDVKNSASFGCFFGKKITDAGLSPACLLANKGTGYSVPKKVYGKELPVICFDQMTDNEHPFFLLTFASDAGNVVEFDGGRWKRWRPFTADIKTPEYETERGLNVFWADTHVHSSYSPDAEGEPEEIIHFAKYISKLDILAMVDNDFYPFYSLSELKWKIHNALAKIYTVEGEFVVLPGYEYTYHDASVFNGFNHRYVLYEGYDGSTLRRIDRDSRNIRDMMIGLKKQKALAFCHHTTWEMTGEDNDRIAEIFSSWRVCAKESDFIDEKIKKKERFAFAGSSDTHRMVPGLGGALTAVYAKRNAPEDIFNAYRSGNTAATQGSRIFIEFYANDVFIGGEGGSSGSIEFHIKVISPVRPEYIDVKKDGEIFKRYDGLKSNLFIGRFMSDNIAKGRHSFYVEVKTGRDDSFNLPIGETDDRRVFYNEGKYPHNFARAEGPYAISSPVCITVK